jgi:hypothetical protein
MTLARAIAGAVLGLLAGACAGVRSGAVNAEESRRVIEHSAAPTIDPRFEESLALVQAAVAEGDDRVARLILIGILARGPDQATREVALRWVDVLDGRAVLAAARFELEVAPDPNVVGRCVVDLAVNTELRSPARFETAPFLATRTVVTLDRLGVERVDSSSFLWEAGSVLTLPVLGRRQVTRVGEATLPSGDAIAARETWVVEVRSGFVHFEGRRLPMRAFAVESRRKEWLAGFLDRGALGPEEFARFVRDPASYELDPEVFTARLLERTLRVPLDRRRDLVPVLVELARSLEDDDFARLLPAVRWLSDEEAGDDVEAWRAAVERFAEPRPEELPPDDELHLPPLR